MNKAKLTLLALLTTVTSSLCAQNVITIEEDSTHTEVIDLPEGMIISEEELLNDYNNKTNLTPGNTAVRELSASDSLLITRLARIPTTIEMPLNDVTRKFIDKYISMRGSVSVMLGASNFYNPIFEEALERYGLPLELRYLPVIESALRPSATSHAGAAGLWQFMIATGKRYGLEVNTLVDERRDPYKASEAAAHYLSDLYNMFGDWGLAIAAYNCGEGNVQKALTRSGSKEGADYWSVYNRLPHETRGYVPAFIAATYIMNYYCEHGIQPREATLPEQADTVVVQREVPFAQIASNCNMPIEQLRSLNPQYRRDIIPAGYVLCLPQDKVEDYILYEDSLTRALGVSPISLSEVRRAVTDDFNGSSNATASTENADDADEEATNSGSRWSRNSRSKKNSRSSRRQTQRQRPVTTSIKAGETLSSIARKNGTTVAQLKKLNGLKSDIIHAGKTLRVK